MTEVTPNAPVIALVAGEASGDLLGAALVERLRQRWPGARFVGVAGPRMQSAGVEAWWDTRELAVMGLFEVLRHFPRLLRIRRDLARRLKALGPDLFIGVDAPDFNLGLETRLRASGLRTVHYVSPTVWAWRQKRVHKIRRAADLVLCLFPFEPGFYEGQGVAATYVGHPMADQIPLVEDVEGDRREARAALGLPPDGTIVALLPGSRMSEVSLLAAPMLEAANRLSARRAEVRFVAAMVGEPQAACLQRAMDASGFRNVLLVQERPREVIRAADVVLCASGTATLEAMLINRPLVVVYRLVRSTYFVAKHTKLIRHQLFALPNILAGEELVPELIQDEANGGRMAAEVERWLDDPEAVARLRNRFAELHIQLRRDASGRAVEAIANLV